MLARREPLAQGHCRKGRPVLDLDKAALDRKGHPALDQGKAARDRRGHLARLPRLGELRLVLEAGRGKAMSC